MKTLSRAAERTVYAISLILWAIALVAFSGKAHSACIDCARPVAVQTAAAPAALPAPTNLSNESALAEDFSAATAEACAPTSETDPSPIDPLACTCNQFITKSLPYLKPDTADIKGPVSALERLRVIKIRGQTSDFRTKFQAACGGLLMSIRDDAMTVAGFVKMLAP